MLLWEVRGDEPGGGTGEVGEAAGVCPVLSRDMAAGRDGGVLLEGSGDGCRDGPAGGCAADAVLPPADEPVGDVDVVAAVAVGGVFLEYIRYGYVQASYGGEFLFPLLISVHVGEGDDFAAPEDGEFFGRELGLAAGGEPDVFGHDAGGDDGGLFGLDEGYGPASAAGFGEQVLAEEALGESWPVRFIREWTQPMRKGVPGSLIRLPVAGSYFMILPVRMRPAVSIWK